MIMKTIQKFLMALRITEQTIYLTPYFFGILASGYRQHTNIYIVALGLAALGLAAFITNEYVDSFDTDKENKRKSAPMDFSQNKLPITIIFILLTIAGSIIFIFYGLIFQLLLLYLFGFFYSFPPLRFKGRFPWDIIAPSISCGLVPYSIGFAFVGSSYGAMLTAAFAVLICAYFCFQGIHEVIDLEADKRGGLTTWATVLGYRSYLRILEMVAILGLLISGYMLYKHESWWLYPVVVVLIYQVLVIGYIRAAVYQPGLERLHKLGKRAFKLGAVALTLILIFQIWALYQPLTY